MERKIMGSVLAIKTILSAENVRLNSGDNK